MTFDNEFVSLSSAFEHRVKINFANIRLTTVDQPTGGNVNFVLLIDIN